jgi:hypothetical protein
LWEDIAKELEVYYEDEYNRFNNYSGEPQTQLIVKGKKQRAISPSKTLEPLYQAHKLSVNMVGKDGLGVVALANKIHPILVSVGARMNAKYYEFDSKSLTYTGIEHPLNLMFDYNKTEDGAISLSYEYNSDKNKIADLHSHLMNGLVDVEKDAWVFYVRANIEQLPVLLHLSEAGVNQEVIAKFLTQPLLRQYITQSGQVSGMYYELKRESEKIKKWEIFGKLFEQTGGKVFTERVLLEANKRRLLDAAKLANDTKAISLIETASELTKLPRVNHNGYTFKSNINIGNKNLLPYVEQILMEEVNVTKFTNKNLTNNLKEPNPVFDLLALTHYLKAEYQSQAYHEAKQMFNPDTQVSKTATASYSRAQAFNEALKNPNIHKETLRRLKEESVLKSFFNNDIAINLLKPMFTLRLNDKLLDYVLKMQSIKSFQIRKRFNNSKDYKDLFNSSYSNAVISHIWQNSMSYMLDENGRRTSLPKVYGSFDIVINNSISEVTSLEGSKLFINTNKLNELFSNLTVTDPKAPIKDKETFARKEIFPNVELLTKFYLELAVQRTMYPNKSKQELIKRALIFSFNPYAMLIDGYSKKIMELVQQNKLQTKFSVLNLLQIAEYPSKKGFSVLTLADNRNINGDLATEFASQLSQLADETVSKVSNKALNYEISEYFKIFSEVLLYQHGSGYSMNGINNVLNVKKITELLDAFGNTFINTELSKEDPVVLDKILKNVLSFDPINNYTNIKATPLEPIIETEEPEEEGPEEAPAKLTTTQPSTSVVERTDKIVLRSELKANPTTLYLFGDNDIRKGLGGQAKEMRGEPNAIGISTKKLPARGEEAYKSDADLQENKKIITDDINKAIAEWNTGKYNKLIIPQMGVGLAELPTRAPETYKFLQQELKRLEDQVTQPSTSVESKRTFKNEEYHQAYIKGGLAAVQEFIQKNKQKEMSAAKQLSKEVDMLTEFEDLNTKTNKTNSDNDRLIELYVLLKNSKELDFEYSLIQIGLSTQPSTSVKPTVDLSREWSGDLESRPVYTSEGVNTMRTKSAKPNEHFGNPWSEGGYAGTIKTSSISEAAQNYKDWLLGNKFQDIKSEQKRWILEQINQGKLDAAKLLYSAKLMGRGQGSHANSLAEVVEQLRTTQPSTQQQTEVKEGVEEVSLEEKQMLNALPEFTSQIKTKSGKTLLSLGITNPEWKAMSDLEKLTLLKCN